MAKRRKKKVTKAEFILALILLIGVTVYRWYEASQVVSYSMDTIPAYMGEAFVVIDENQPYTIFDPVQTWKQKDLTDFYIKEVLVPVFQGGKLVYNLPNIEEIRLNCEREFNTLWSENTRFSNPNKYYVDLSQKLWDLKNDMLTSYFTQYNKK